MGIAYQRATVLYQQHRYAQAKQEYERDLAEEPRKSNTVAMIAMCLTHLKKIKEARITAEQAIALDPGNSFAHYSLAWVLYKDDEYASRRGLHFAVVSETLKKQRFKLAETALLEALRLQPRNSNYHWLLAFTRLARGNNHGALDSANACLAIEPQHSDAHRAAALALARLGQVAQAQDASANAVSVQPLGPEAHLTRAFMLLRHAKPAQALPHFQEAVRLEPNSLGARRGLTECLRQHLRFYRLRGRLNYRPRFLVVLIIISFVFIDAMVTNELTDSHPDRFRNPWHALLLLGLVLVLCWLCFSRNVADLLLLRDRVAARLISKFRRITSWLVTACMAGAIMASLGLLTASLIRGDPIPFISIGGASLAIASVVNFFLILFEQRLAKKG